MGAPMVPFVLLSFFGLFPESRRFLAYWASIGTCANTGVAAVADSSTAAARALNENIVVSPVSIGCGLAWGQDKAVTLHGKRAVRSRAIGFAASDADAFTSRCRKRSPPFH